MEDKQTSFTIQYMPTSQSCFLISEPDPSRVIIQNLTYTQLNTSTSEKYDYLISWQKPQFSESDVSTYAIECRRTGNPDRARVWTTKKVNFLAIIKFPQCRFRHPFSLIHTIFCGYSLEFREHCSDVNVI